VGSPRPEDGRRERQERRKRRERWLRRRGIKDDFSFKALGNENKDEVF
jgi:hypothetical protein